MMYQLRVEQLRGRLCIVFRSLTRGSKIESKMTIGGFEFDGDQVRGFPIMNEILLGGRINFYGVIKQHLKIRRAIKTASQ